MESRIVRTKQCMCCEAADKKKKHGSTTKRVVWFCLINGVLWTWCSYFLAFLGKTDIAEGLSKVAVTEIVGVVLVYCAKSLFEKRESFGAVGKREDKPASETETTGYTRDL